MALRVLLAFDDRAVRRAVCRALSAAFPEVLCGEASTPAQAIALLAAHWDVIVLGPANADDALVAAVPAIHAMAPEAPILLVARPGDAITADDATVVQGDIDVLVEAVRAAAKVGTER